MRTAEQGAAYFPDGFVLLACSWAFDQYYSLFLNFGELIRFRQPAESYVHDL